MDGAFEEVARGTTERECTNGARDATGPKKQALVTPPPE